MPTFTYTARTRTGTIRRGSVTADNREAAVAQLARMGLEPEKIVEARGVGARAQQARLNRRVRGQDLLVFTRQLSTIVSAGLPLMQGLDILAEQTEDPRFAKIIAAIGQSVESGETFSDALRNFNRAFPDIYISMVRAGEASGDLDGVLL
ncbi:MAG TPA: type II secretion system F family protein, partial [Candidatus Hydrogenedentes bacterium]|nr:type II secretion system F family protein [Candidatus Hydrogenedentota bacterium]